MAPMVATRDEFARALTELRQRAGLTVRDVAKSIDAAPATVGGYFSGKHLPPRKMAYLLTGILDACGVTDAEERARWHAMLAELRCSSANRMGTAPYKGLAPFDVQDAKWFFGRTRLTNCLCDAVANRLIDPGPVLVIGPSGSGKSSLLRAGLLAALGRGALADGVSANWPALVCTPGAHPLDTMATALAPLVDAPAEELSELLADDPVDCRERIRARLAAHAGASPQRLVLVIDQFEEAFAAGAEATEREKFVSALSAFALEPWSPSGDVGVLVVLALRADFYSTVIGFPTMLPLLGREPVPVGAMSEPELREVIIGPAAECHFQVDTGLVELLLHDLATPSAGADGCDPGSLPLLSHVLLSTWQRSKHQRLTSDDYIASGGICSAVTHSAEAVFENLTAEQRAVTRNVFMRLVHVDEHIATTRRRAPCAEFVTAGTEDENTRIAEVLNRFTEARLLTREIGSVAISHEALISAWARLGEWVDADRESVRLQRRLSAAARSWSDSDRDPRLLSLGSLLSWAETRHLDTPPALTPLETEFLTASEQRRDRARLIESRRTQRQRRRRWVITALVVLVFAAAGLSGFVIYQRGVAREQRAAAISRQVATESDMLRGGNTALAGQLAVVAYRTAPTPQAVASVIDAYAAPTATNPGGPTGLTHGPPTIDASADDMNRAVARWATDPLLVVNALCYRAGPPITRAEWSEYVSELPYNPPCA